MISCPSCNAISISLVGEIPPSDYFGGRILDRPLHGGKLYRCHKCDLNFRFPRLSKQEMDALYLAGDSGHWQHVPQHRVDWLIAADVIRSNFANGKILDVGCFDGQFLGSLGGDYDIAGVEIHQEAARNAEERGVRIVGRDYQDIDGIEEGFNVVVATDVIEHAPDPFAFLNALSVITMDGGIIIVATGNTAAFPWRLLGSRYGYCAIAEHISFINPGWCLWAARRLGLDVEMSKTYCHTSVSFPIHMAGIGKGMLYRAAPNFFALLRSNGFSGVDAKQRPAMATYPPAWHGAVDHFLTVFRKK